MAQIEERINAAEQVKKKSAPKKFEGGGGGKMKMKELQALADQWQAAAAEAREEAEASRREAQSWKEAAESWRGSAGTRVAEPAVEEVCISLSFSLLVWICRCMRYNTRPRPCHLL